MSENSKNFMINENNFNFFRLYKILKSCLKRNRALQDTLQVPGEASIQYGGKNFVTSTINSNFTSIDLDQEDKINKLQVNIFSIS